MLISQIQSQNPRIRSNTTRRKKKNRKPGGEDRPGKPGEATTPGERTAGYHSAAVVPDTCPNFSFFGTKKFVHNTFIFVENPSRIFDPYSSTIAKLLTTVLLLLLLDMFPVAAGIAERVSGAAALFKVIVSSFPDFLSVTLSSFLSSVILHIHCVFSFKYTPSSPIFGHVDPIIVGLNPSFDWVFIFLFSSTCLRKSLMSSSHLFLGLPIALLVLYLELRSGFHSAAFFSHHLSHGEVAILSANFHFIFLCVLFQQRIFARSILSKASAVLLFMYSIQSSSSISIVSISLSESSSNVTSLSTSSLDFVL